MPKEETIIMTKKELAKLTVINQLIEGLINGTEASMRLEVSTRQIRRMKVAVVALGEKGIIHKSRGRPSPRKLNEDIESIIKDLLKEKYYYFGPTLASEYLAKYDKTIISKEKVRQLMIEEGLWKAKQKNETSKHRKWRERKPRYGEMQQFDGSYHHWFGEEEYCLLLAIDDATSRITHAKFDKNEGRIAVFKFWIEYMRKHGKPYSIYLDKFSTYKINHKNAEDNKELLTQFQKGMEELDVGVIPAHSAEAKGRVERNNETLQDRLVKALRFLGIKTVEEANKYLEDEFIKEHNEKFAVLPRDDRDMHSPINMDIDLESSLSIKEERTVCNDYTIRYKNSYYQLKEIQPISVSKGDKITIETRVTGEIRLKKKDQYLDFFILPERPKKEIEICLPAITKQQSDWKPPAEHPWKRASFKRREALNNQQVGHF